MNERKVIEISLSELLIVLLRKWWIIVLCAFIVSGIFGAGVYVYTIINIDEHNARYRMELSTYNQKLQEKEDDLKNYIAKRDAQLLYNNQSILMQIDPYNMRVAHLSLAVNVDGISNQETLNQTILSFYRTLAKAAPVERLFNEEERKTYSAGYLKELVYVIDPSTPNHPTIEISAYGNESIDPARVLTSLFDYLQENQGRIAASTSPHQLNALNSIESAYESNNAFAQNLRRNVTIVAEDGQKIKELEGDIDNLKRNVPSDKILTRKLLDNTSLCFLVFLLITSIIIIIDYLIHIYIQTDEQIKARLGIRYLGGGLCKKRRFIGRLGDKLSGIYKLASDSTVKALVQANIKFATCGIYDCVLVTGTVEQTILDSLASELSLICPDERTNFIAARDVVNDAIAVEYLEKAQAVIFVERVGYSKLKSIDRSIERARQSNKCIIGYTLL